MPVKTMAALLFACLLSPLFPLLRTIEDFGGKADGKTDCGPAFAKAFAFAKTNPGTTLRLGGPCRITTPQATEAIFKMAGRGEYLTNLTMEDGEILLGGPFGCFVFAHCPNLTLRRIAFDYDPPILSQGRILSSSRADLKMTVVADPGFPVPGPVLFSNRGNTWFTVHKPGGEYGFHFVGYVPSATVGENGQVTLTHDRGDLAQLLEGAVDWRYVRMQRGYGHLNIYKFCDGLKLQDTRIHASSAFASLFIFCNDAVLLSNRICPRPGGANQVATCADGFHFIGARRGPKIEGNFFDRLQDDNIVISLRGARVKSYKGDTIELQTASVTWYEAGDTLELVEVGSGKRTEYRIKAMAPMPNVWQPGPLTLDRPIEGKVVATEDAGPEDLPTLAFNKSWRMDGTRIRGNQFQNSRRFAVFMGAGGVRIENNRMSNHTSAAILVSHTQALFKKHKSELIYYFSDNILIASNRIDHALDYGEGGRNFSARGALGAIDLYNFEGASSIRTSGLTDGPLARNLEFRGNLIVNSGAAGIYVPNAAHVRLIDNTIIHPNRNLTNERYGILVERSQNVVLSGNVVKGSGIDEAVRQVP
jgi:hypothetical protein